MQVTENQIEKIIEILKESNISSYKISKGTGIAQATIGNYRNGRTKPTPSNALILMQFFKVGFTENITKNSENSINGTNNVIGDNSHIDNRQYYSDSPDVLRKEIELLDERIKEKDALIGRLLTLVENQSAKNV